MMKNLIRSIVLCSMAVLLNACETPVKIQTLPDIIFAHLAPISLNIARVEIVSEFRAPLRAPNVDHLFHVSPEKALRNWVRDRIVPSGVTGKARFIIKNASATESKLATDKGFIGQFKKELSERYTVYVEGELQIIDASGVVRAQASAKAERSRTIREDASLNDREKLWHDITRAALIDFNGVIQGALKTHASRWMN